MKIREIIVESTGNKYAAFLEKYGFQLVNSTETPGKDSGYGHQVRMIVDEYELLADYKTFQRVDKNLKALVKRSYGSKNPIELGYDYANKGILIKAKLARQEDVEAPTDRPTIHFPFFKGPFQSGDYAVLSAEGNNPVHSMGIIGVSNDFKRVKVVDVLPNNEYKVRVEQGNINGKQEVDVPGNMLTGVVMKQTWGGSSGSLPRTNEEFDIRNFGDYDFRHYIGDSQRVVALTGVSKKDSNRYLLDTGYVDQLYRRFVDRSFNHMKRVPKEEWWNTLSPQEKARYTN